VIDDDPRVLRVLRRLFTCEGYTVLTAVDARSGHDIAMSSDADVVLLDLTLPDADGLEVCRDLRREGFSRPIVAVSARGDAAEETWCAVGLTDYVAKPFDPSDLLGRVGRLVHARGN
jgi:two-component system response regulator MprA